ncbi:MAG: MoaD/ThiS family protein [Actinobacteria bacterium]|nr:MoaD/ThiS family protein [Actinomycetota bacterium]
MVSIKVEIFYPELRRLLGGSEEVRVEGGTVGECLDELIRQHPDVRRLLFDSRGHLLKKVYVYVNAEGLYKAEMSKPVRDTDVLIIAVLAAGG